MTWQRLKLAHFLRGLECFLNKPFRSDYPPRISPFSLCRALKWLPWEDGKPLIYPEVAHCMMARERECFILAMQRFPSDRLLRGYCIIAEISVLQTTVFNSTTLCLNTEHIAWCISECCVMIQLCRTLMEVLPVFQIMRFFLLGCCLHV